MEPTIDKRSPSAKFESRRALCLKFKDRPSAITRRFIIGRDRTTDIPLPRDPLVSRQHARIEFVDGIYYIHDLRSTNGTYVNSNPLLEGERQALDNGDVITIGKTAITVSPEMPEDLMR